MKAIIGKKLIDIYRLLYGARQPGMHNRRNLIRDIFGRFSSTENRWKGKQKVFK